MLAWSSSRDGWERVTKKELKNLRYLDWTIDFLYVKLFKTKLAKNNYCNLLIFKSFIVILLLESEDPATVSGSQRLDFLPKKADILFVNHPGLGLEMRPRRWALVWKEGEAPGFFGMTSDASSQACRALSILGSMNGERLGRRAV